MTTKENLNHAVDRFLALPDIEENEKGILQAVAAMACMYDIIRIQGERIKELENENEVFKRSL
jgi:hypothetical protein